MPTLPVGGEPPYSSGGVCLFLGWTRRSTTLTDVTTCWAQHCRMRDEAPHNTTIKLVRVGKRTPPW